MAYLPLLERQIKKYLKKGIPEEIRPLLDAINNSYEHYERDHALGLKSLEISSNELRQLVEQNQDKQERLKAILNSASDGILVLNEIGLIQECNNTALNYFGYASAEDIIGKNIHLLRIKIAKKETSLFELLSQIESKKLHEIEILKNDVSLPIELSVSELILQSEKLKICVLRDISIRKKADKSLELKHSVTRLLANAKQFNEGIHELLKLLSEELGFDAAIFCEPSSSSYFIYNPLHLDLKVKSGFLCLNDSRSNIKSYIKLPLFFEDMLLGTIQLLSNRDNVYIDESLEADIAGQISLYIEKERIHRQEKKLQQELIASAKQAGMTQVANSVLHNVGNVLNSLNISASLLGENLSKSELNSLPKLSRMLQENAKNLESYLSHDPKGKLIPAFIVELSKKWEDELKNYKKEAKIILDSIYTIKNLIKTQLSPEENTSTLEKVQIRTLLDEIIAMKEDEFKIHRIQIIKDCPFTIECLTDKNRLSQVIVNILNNAIEATEDLSEREINIKMENTGASLLIHFTDNGVGLDLNQLEKLFSYGFTTKKSGHGFGLYTSLMQLKEIGGDLKATSSGKSRGATFTICLPLLKPSLV